MTEVTAYNNPSAPIYRQWIAYVVMDNGNLWGVYAIGATEDAAKTKIQILWESERAKISLNPQPSAYKPEPKLAPASLPAGWGENSLSFNPSPFKGMVWLLNKASREKVRVSPENAELMLATGKWERGGPRSK